MIKPYSKITTVKMWTDEYISKQMLTYHIDGSNDAASRKEETIQKTVEFISSIIKPDSKICDFGCGPGLYTNKLQMNHQVIGVDVSENSLNYARTNNKEVQYIKMNYVEEVLNQKVDFAMMIYCDFGALNPESQEKVLNNIHNTLHEDGMFFFDVLSLNHYGNAGESNWEKCEVDGFFMPGPCTITTEVLKYPDLNLILNHQVAKGQRTFEVYNWDKCYSIEEMTKILSNNHFEVVDTYSDTMGNKDFTNSTTITFLCKKH